MSVTTIYVLGFGELYKLTLNAMASFMGAGKDFQSLLQFTGLIGIIMASVGFIKQRDPMIYAKWVMAYVLVFQVAVLPKTDVQIYDIAAQKTIVVGNVPALFAETASLITGVGYAVAQRFDMLFATLSGLGDESGGDLTYTKTGMLFGSKLVQAARDFKIIDPNLREEMNGYIRNCVVGDIRLTQRYTMKELGESTNIWDLISKSPSPIRMTKVNGKLVTCLDAASVSSDSTKNSHSIKAKLDAELKNAYTIFGLNLFGRPNKTTEETFFETHLTSAFKYYQLMTDESVNITLQSMMINAVGDGIKDYQAFTDSTAGIINNQVSKSEVQHRWAWQIAGEKAAWFLPILQALLTNLLFGIFPIVVVMATLPNGGTVFKGYLQILLSLQFWPVFFAILNAAMTFYARNKGASFGGISLVNLDKIDEFHADISGVAGYLMLMIPFISKGLVSNLSDAFNNLATSMTGHLQGSAMSVANDAASASFSLGQTSFYNTSANNFSANKHDSNWTNMHGMHTEQASTGVTKTTTASGNTVFDVSPAMTRSAVGINKTDGLMSSLHEAQEESRQAGINEHQSFQNSVSNFAHRAMQLSQLSAHDMRLGDGVSASDTGQYQESLASMQHIATDVAKRTGVSVDDAYSKLTTLALNGQISPPGLLGLASRAALGISGNIAGHNGDSSSHTDKAHDSVDGGILAREAKDFSSAFTRVSHFVKNHHFDDTQSTGANLSNQMGADLRDAQVASSQYDATLTRASRIQQAENYVQSHGDQITENLEQEFASFVEKQVGGSARDRLFTHPGDAKSVETLKTLGQEFLKSEREAVINGFDINQKKADVDHMYQTGVKEVGARSAQLESAYEANAQRLHDKGDSLGVGVDKKKVDSIKADVNHGVLSAEENIQSKQERLQNQMDEMKKATSKQMKSGKWDAKRSVIINFDKK